MAGVEWRGQNVYDLIAQETISAMKTSMEAGADAGRAQSRLGPTGRYQAGWEASEPTLNGTTIHGEIFNEAAGDDGHMYARYPSAGTSKMAGDFAHAAALDRAASDLVPQIAARTRRVLR